MGVGRSRLARLAIALLLVAGCGSSPATNPSSNPSAPVDTPSVYGLLFSRAHADGSVDRDTALQAFSLAIAPLPGVTIPAGPPPSDAERADGSFAIDWLAPYRTSLTSAQEAAVEAALAPDPNAPVVAPGTSQGGAIRLAALTDDPATPYRDALAAAEPVIAAHLHRPLHLSWSVTMRATQPSGSVALASTEVDVLPGVGRSGCAFIVNPDLVARNDPTLTRATMAHEMFHCFQHDLLDRNGVDETMPPSWITEGQAEWVGEAVAGPSSVGRYWWIAYLATETRPLFQRTYDALGFYQHLAEVEIDPWTTFDAMLVASDDVSAFKAAGATADAFLDTWASGLFRNPSYGLPWNATSPWTTSMVVHPATAQVPALGGVAVSSPVVVNTDLDVTSSADVVEIRVPGHARLHTTPPGEETGLDQFWLCTKSGGCACPDGQRYDGPPLETVSPTFQLALTGSLGGIEGNLYGHRLDEFCQPDASNDQGSGGGGGGGGGRSPTCGNGCASSNGDPHLATVDGHTYDLQATGEFVLLRSPDGSLEIQARQEPAPGSPGVSINTALAARVDGHSVQIDVTTGGLALQVDGQAVEVPADGLAVGAGKVVGHADGDEVDFPDGTALWAIAISNWGINVQVRPSAALRSGGVGLLGTVLPGGLGVPALPDGTRLARAADSHDRYQKLYQQLAPAWRVTAQSSLFTQAAGRGPDAYVVSGFPPEAQVRTIDQADPGRVQYATTVCAAISDAGAKDDCVFDVSFTGSRDYVALYSVTDQLLQQGPTALDQPVVRVGSLAGALPPGFTIVAPSMSLIGGSVLAPDGTLYLSVSEPNDEHELLAVDTATGTIAARIATAGSGDVAFANGSAWAGELDGGTDCGVTRLDPRSLAVRAHVAIPCDILGSTFASLGDAVWFVDRTAADADGKGGQLRRIDPSTNAIGSGPSDAVALPFLNGHLVTGNGAIFYGDLDHGWYRLRAGAITFELLGSASPPVFAGNQGVWSDDGGTATLHAGGADVSIPFDGSLCAADTTAIYASLADPLSGTPTLWRYPADGGPPRAVAIGTTVRTSRGGSIDLGYADNDPLLIGERRVVKLWVIPAPTDPTSSAVVMQVSPLQ